MYGSSCDGREAPAGPEPDRHRRVEVTARDRAERVGAGQHRQAERERHADEADAEFRERGRQHRAAAAAEHQPERAEQLGGEFRCHVLSSPCCRAGCGAKDTEQSGRAAASAPFLSSASPLRGDARRQETGTAPRASRSSARLGDVRRTAYCTKVQRVRGYRRMNTRSQVPCPSRSPRALNFVVGRRQSGLAGSCAKPSAVLASCGSAPRTSSIWCA